MEIFIAMFDASATIAAVMMAIVALYLALRLVYGVGVYCGFRGSTLVTCPERRQAAVVELDATSMGLQAILGTPRLRLSECSRWPMSGGCAQRCLLQIEAHVPDVRLLPALSLRKND